MQVIYRKPISEQIHDAIVKAELENRKIEKILLTKDEYDDLEREALNNFHVRRQGIKRPHSKEMIFCGVYLEIDDKAEF